MLVRENLDFDMARARKEFLQEDGSITEGGLGFGLRVLKAGGELLRIVDHAHAAATTTHGGFHNHGIPDLAGDLVRFRGRRDRAFRARQHRHAG